MTIRAIELTKRFGDRLAVAGLSFEVRPGEVVGFLGPNGAGKTTTMRLLTAYLRADSGRAEILGHDVAREPVAARRRLGYLPENNPLPDDLEVGEALELTARLRGVDDPQERLRRVRRAVELCGLAREIGRRTGELSKGLRQRLGLAQAILHEPDALILDEPTSGLDPNQTMEVRALIERLKEGRMVLFSTHILSEATAVCDRLLIINAGRIAADGTPDQVRGALERRRRLYVELKAAPQEARAALAALPGATSIADAEDEPGFFIEAEGDADLREPVFELAAARRWPILGLRRERPTLEEVFRALTQAS